MRRRGSTFFCILPVGWGGPLTPGYAMVLSFHCWGGAGIEPFPATHEEPGCLKVEVPRPKEHTARLVFVEHYASHAALDHHLGTERIKAFREAMPPIVSSRELTFCDVEEFQGGWPTVAAVPWRRSRGGGGLTVAKNRHAGRAAG